MRGERNQCQPGEKFGKLRIVKSWTELVGSKKLRLCECKCKCGNVIVTRATNLRSFGKSSCGCDEGRGCRVRCQPGNKYGLLTIQKTWSEKFPAHKSKEKVCECKCDCGEIVVVRARYIRKDHKQSCGCLRHVNNKNHHAWKGHGEISGSVWTSIKRGCVRKTRTIPFDLTIEQAWKLFQKQDGKCALSGAAIQFSKKARQYDPSGTASLDRIDSSGPYKVGNVQWVHKELNFMKGRLSQDAFVKWCKAVANCDDTHKIVAA